jgi:uncharacterized protein (TIGR02449 family)
MLIIHEQDVLIMDNNAFQNLERKISALIKSYESLQDENDLLRDKYAVLLAERNALLEQNKTTVERITHLVDKIKSNENSL